MRTLAELIALTFLIGCTARSDAGEGSTVMGTTGDAIGDESDDGLETGEVEPGEVETGEPLCNEEACDAACSLELDECDQAMAGYCELPDLCTCYSSEPCIDCESAEDCDGPWEQCHPEFGCSYCYTTTNVVWDPLLACMLDFSSIDPIVVPYIVFEIESIQLPVNDSCDAMPVGVTWLADLQLQLCPDTCAAFEDAEQLAVTFGCPGGP
jgi:hypothetical protein